MIGGDQGAKIVAEAQLIWRAIVQRPDTHLRKMLRCLGCFSRDTRCDFRRQIVPRFAPCDSVEGARSTIKDCKKCIEYRRNHYSPTIMRLFNLLQTLHTRGCIEYVTQRLSEA